MGWQTRNKVVTRILEAREAGRLDPKVWTNSAIGRHVGESHHTVGNISSAMTLQAFLNERGLDADVIDATKPYRIAVLKDDDDRVTIASAALEKDEDGNWLFTEPDIRSMVLGVSNGLDTAAKAVERLRRTKQPDRDHEMRGLLNTFLNRVSDVAQLLYRVRVVSTT